MATQERNREETYKEGAWERLERNNNPCYWKARKLWKEYVEGKITAGELEKSLKEL